MPDIKNTINPNKKCPKIAENAVELVYFISDKSQFEAGNDKKNETRIDIASIK